MNDASRLNLAGRSFVITVTRDDMGNYSVDAARAREGAAASLPLVRMVDLDRGRALHAVVESLEAMAAGRA